MYGPVILGALAILYERSEWRGPKISLNKDIRSHVIDLDSTLRNQQVIAVWTAVYVGTFGYLYTQMLIQ